MARIVKLPLGIRNNNPLNIRYSPLNNWKGQTGCNRGFCTFESQFYGFRAAWLLLHKYLKRGLCTIYQIVSTWAPASENDVDAYVLYVRNLVGIGSSVRITDDLTLFRLMLAMAAYECGTTAGLDYKAAAKAANI